MVNVISNAAARHANGSEITRDDIRYVVANDAVVTNIAKSILEDAFAVDWAKMRNNKHLTMLKAIREAIERQDKHSSDPVMDGLGEEEWWRSVEGVLGEAASEKQVFYNTFNALKELEIVVFRDGKGACS